MCLPPNFPKAGCARLMLFNPFTESAIGSGKRVYYNSGPHPNMCLQ